jgi:hypothetical protein
MLSSLQQYKFVLAIPIINAVASNTTEYFQSALFNPGNLRAIIIGVFALYFIFTKLPNERIFRFIMFYLLFYLLLVLISTDKLHSGNLFLKFFLGIIMFPIGYYYIDSVGKFKGLVTVLFFTLLLHLTNLAIANIFKLGTSDYLDESFYFGAGRVNITKNILILVFMVPVTLLFTNKHKLKVIFVFLIAFVVTIIGIKRSVLVSGAVGFIIYLVIKQKISQLFKIVIASALLIFLIITILPRLTGLITARFNARSDRVEISEETLETEGRFDETKQVWINWKLGSMKHKLIGSEVFNDRIFYNSKRMLHTDYMVILNGSGIIGLFLWFYMLVIIIREKGIYYSRLKKNTLFQEMNAVFWILISTQLIISISGTVYAIEVRSLLFLIWGAFIGTMRGYLKNLYISQKSGSDLHHQFGKYISG